MNEIMLSGVIVGILAMLFFTPFCMARGIDKMDGSNNPILCALPIINMIRAEKKYYGRVGLILISTILLFLGIGARFYLWFNYYSNVTLGTISIIIFWGVIIFYYISNVIFVYTVIHDADVASGFKLFIMVVAYPFGQYYIGSFLNNVIAHNKAMEDTFKG